MISKLRRHLHEQGTRATAEKFLLRLREGYVREELIVLLKDLDAIVRPRFAGDLRVEGLESRHLAGISALNRKRNEPGADRYFSNALEKGFQGFVALRDDEIVGYYHWVDCEAPTEHPDLWFLGPEFELRPGDVYGSGFFLLKEHRGGGTASDFLFKIESSLRDRGYRQLWGYVESGNRPARWTYRNRGYEPMWNVLYQRLIFFRWRKMVQMSNTESSR
jgi:GNAT superfamily N-acetyltransferase